MSHCRNPSPLSRGELYADGFKEDEPWAEDRHSLKGALNAMDALEREIQQNYLQPGYNISRGPIPSTHGSAYPWLPTLPYRHAPPHFAPLPDVGIARSDEYTLSETGHEGSRGWNASRVSRDVDPASGDFIGRLGRQHSEGAYYPRVDNFSATFQRGSEGLPYASPSMTSWPRASQSFYQPSSPSLSASSSRSSYREPRGVEDLPPAQIGESLGSPQVRAGWRASQMQPVRYDGNSHAPLQHEQNSDDESNNDQYTRGAPFAGLHWPTNITRGMSAEIDLPYSGSYGTHTRSGGYVEPYGVDPHEDQFLDYRNRRDNFDEDCEDFMSDGVASDEGVYYSSGAEEGYDVDDDGPEEYSDEGYSSPSDEYYDDD